MPLWYYSWHLFRERLLVWPAKSWDSDSTGGFCTYVIHYFLFDKEVTLIKCYNMQPTLGSEIRQIQATTQNSVNDCQNNLRMIVN